MQQYMTYLGMMEMVVPIAGESVMEVPLTRRERRGRGLFQSEEDGRSGATRLLTEEDIGGIETELQDLANDILIEWNRRHSKSDFEVAIYESIGSAFPWGNDLANVRNRPQM